MWYNIIRCGTACDERRRKATANRERVKKKVQKTFEKPLDKPKAMWYNNKVARTQGSIAQLGEHLPYKQRVTGSSPVVPTKYGPVVQLVRTLACHARGQGFESPSGRHNTAQCCMPL